MTASVNGAPICAGGASPLRVATGGNANWSSGVRSRRSPARANKRRDNVPGNPGEASLLRSSENCSKNLIHIGHLFMTNPRASLRSDNCPISIGMSVRFELEQVSAFAGIRNLNTSTMIYHKRRIADAIANFMGADIIIEIQRRPGWKESINCTREKMACRDERRHL